MAHGINSGWVNKNLGPLIRAVANCIMDIISLILGAASWRRVGGTTSAGSLKTGHRFSGPKRTHLGVMLPRRSWCQQMGVLAVALHARHRRQCGVSKCPGLYLCCSCRSNHTVQKGPPMYLLAYCIPQIASAIQGAVMDKQWKLSPLLQVSTAICSLELCRVKAERMHSSCILSDADQLRSCSARACRRLLLLLL